MERLTSLILPMRGNRGRRTPPTRSLRVVSTDAAKPIDRRLIAAARGRHRGHRRQPLLRAAAALRDRHVLRRLRRHRGPAGHRLADLLRPRDRLPRPAQRPRRPPQLVVVLLVDQPASAWRAPRRRRSFARPRAGDRGRRDDLGRRPDPRPLRQHDRPGGRTRPRRRHGDERPAHRPPPRPHLRRPARRGDRAGASSSRSRRSRWRCSRSRSGGRCRAAGPPTSRTYGELLGSIVAMVRREPVLRRRMVYGACGFACFQPRLDDALLPALRPALQLRRGEDRPLRPRRAGRRGLRDADGPPPRPRPRPHRDRRRPRRGPLGWPIFFLGRHSVLAILAGLALLDFGVQGQNVLSQGAIYALGRRDHRPGHHRLRHRQLHRRRDRLRGRVDRLERRRLVRGLRGRRRLRR